IRYKLVTGVQTCALPIYKDELSVIPIDYKWFQNGLQQKKLKVPLMEGSKGFADNAPLIIMLSTRDLRQFVAKYADDKDAFKANRSEERRVGKECRYRCGR